MQFRLKGGGFGALNYERTQIYKNIELGARWARATRAYAQPSHRPFSTLRKKVLSTQDFSLLSTPLYNQTAVMTVNSPA